MSVQTILDERLAKLQMLSRWHGISVEPTPANPHQHILYLEKLLLAEYKKLLFPSFYDQLCEEMEYHGNHPDHEQTYSNFMAITPFQWAAKARDMLEFDLAMMSANQSYQFNKNVLDSWKER